MIFSGFIALPKNNSQPEKNDDYGFQIINSRVDNFRPHFPSVRKSLSAHSKSAPSFYEKNLTANYSLENHSPQAKKSPLSPMMNLAEILFFFSGVQIRSHIHGTNTHRPIRVRHLSRSLDSAFPLCRPPFIAAGFATIGPHDSLINEFTNSISGNSTRC